jgi:nucleotide-binding universal stress UspA family protein
LILERKMAAKSGFRRILVAVDGSEVSMKAVDNAARIARYEGASLTALHVIPTPGFEISGQLADYYEQARKPAKKWMKEVENVAAVHGLSIRTETLVGALSVIDAILGYAENQSVDLIVTGHRGRTQSNKLLLGSVAAGLVEYAECPVLMIR